MVCNIRATKEQLAVADDEIKRLAQKVAGYRTALAKIKEVPAGDTRFDTMMEEVRGIAEPIAEGLAKGQKNAYDHMSEHATSWALAGFPEGSEDQQSVVAQEEIREAFRQRSETLFGIINDLATRRPKEIVVQEEVKEEVTVDQAAAILKALGRR